MSSRSDDTYLFIDGEYLRRAYNEAIQSVFQVDGEIDFNELKRQAMAKRAFFYDCLDDVQRAGESEADYKSRVAAQEKVFGAIRDLKGFHVRLGSLRGAKRPRQKEVDVLLAVDMMANGFDGNMETAVLVAGDLDFRPIVEALVRRGVFIEIWYEQKSLAQELKWAGDFGRQLGFLDFYRMSTASFTSRNSLPRFDRAHAPVSATSVRVGSFEGRDVRLFSDVNGRDFILRLERPDGVWWYDYTDPGVLERYFSVTVGPIEWK
jgi:uncharacterized LabA/DUF88 family protein